jgi:hypothetical protein
MAGSLHPQTIEGAESEAGTPFTQTGSDAGGVVREVRSPDEAQVSTRTASGSCSNMTLYYGSASNPTNLSLPTLAG